MFLAFLRTHFKMSLSLAKKTFTPANINSVVITTSLTIEVLFKRCLKSREPGERLQELTGSCLDIKRHYDYLIFTAALADRQFSSKAHCRWRKASVFISMYLLSISVSSTRSGKAKKRKTYPCIRHIALKNP